MFRFQLMASPLRRSTRKRTAAVALVSSLHTVETSSSANDDDTHMHVESSKKRVKLRTETKVVRATTPSPQTPRATPKVKKQKASLPEDYPKRATSDWKVGAHVSAAGGVENAILNAAYIGANAFALFVKSQRKWTSPCLTQSSIELFKSRLLQFEYHPDFVLPHGSYLVNIGNPDKEKREKSYECFLDDLRRCESLGLTRYNFHPGSTLGAATKEESIAHVAQCINRAHWETSNIVIVVENMAGSGNVLGSKFEEIAQIIELVDDKSRVGTCLDTCHVFAAGYDIRTKDTYEAMMSEFEHTIGLQYLRGMHLNDSKSTLASKKDRHQNIGLGELGLPTFSFIMRDSRLKNIPLILETPTNEDTNIWKREIEVLNILSQNPDAEVDVGRLRNSIIEVTSHSTKTTKSRKRKRKEKETEGGQEDSEEE